MLDVLMYLFETYLHNGPKLHVDQDQLTDDPAHVGFHLDYFYK